MFKEEYQDMFKNWSLRHRIILTAILPTIIVTIILGSYFTFVRTNDLKENLLEHGQLILTEASVTAAYSIQNKNPEILKSFIENAKRDLRIKYISIYNDKNEVIDGDYNKDLNNLNINDINSIKYSHIINGNTSRQEFKHNDTFVFVNKINPKYKDDDPRQYLSQSSNVLNQNERGYWVVVALKTNVYQEKIFSAIIALTISFMWGVIVSIIAGFKISTQVATPLISAIGCVNLIRKGNLKVRMNAKCQGEMKQLQLGVNNMAEQLENVHETMSNNINTATKELRETLQHVAIQNDQLDHARKDALSASKAKSEFLANMSHEIRTPMNSILGFTNLLLQSNPNKEQEDYLNTIDQSAQNLLTIINDILDLSKIESDSFELFPDIFKLSTCINSVNKMLSPQLNAKKLKASVNIAKDIPENIIQDSLRLKQVLTNLTNNAIKFTNTGDIKINVTKVSNKYQNYILKVEVVDSGIGISKDGIKKLFSSFSQADSSATRKYSGTGLGLTISKKIVEKMSGEIGVSSIKNKGSNFWFTFACKESLSEPPVITNKINNNINLNNKNNLTILSVDDNKANLKLITSIIKNLGHQTVSYDNATDAVKYFKDNHENIDLIFMDIQMPIMDGFEAAKKINEISKSHKQKTPLIALTADVFAETKDKIFKSGFSGYQTKPITQEQIIKLIKKNNKLATKEINKNIKNIKNKKNKEELINIKSALDLTGGDESLVKEMQGMLLEELKTEGLSIKDLYENNDIAALKALAHKIQGGASYCGTVRLRSDSRSVERSCILLEKDKNNKTKLDKDVKNLIDTIKLTIIELNKI